MWRWRVQADCSRHEHWRLEKFDGWHQTSDSWVWLTISLERQQKYHRVKSIANSNIELAELHLILSFVMNYVVFSLMYYHKTLFWCSIVGALGALATLRAWRPIFLSRNQPNLNHFHLQPTKVYSTKYLVLTTNPSTTSVPGNKLHILHYTIQTFKTNKMLIKHRQNAVAINCNCNNRCTENYHLINFIQSAIKFSANQHNREYSHLDTLDEVRTDCRRSALA